MKNIQKYLEDALKHINIADHMVYTTYPLVNEKKLLLKILEQLNKSLISLVYSSLLLKNIKITNNNNLNIKSFKKVSSTFSITKKESIVIEDIFNLSNNHIKSAIEFTRKERVIIMMDDLKTIPVDMKTMKIYLSTLKSIYLKLNIFMDK
jgi:hypothetical protein